ERVEDDDQGAPAGKPQHADGGAERKAEQGGEHYCGKAHREAERDDLEERRIARNDQEACVAQAVENGVHAGAGHPKRRADFPQYERLCIGVRRAHRTPAIGADRMQAQCKSPPQARSPKLRRSPATAMGARNGPALSATWARCSLSWSPISPW